MDVGVDAILQIGTISVYADLQATSPDFNRAMQPIILATGTGNSVAGYQPSTGAKSGFKTKFALPYTAPATLLNAILSSTPFPITLYLGTAGGAKVLNNLCTDLQVSGAEGGGIDCTATFDSSALPTITPTAPSAPTGGVFKFVDATSVLLVSGTTYTDFSRFSFRVTRKLATYKGNSSTGIAKYLKIVRTECMLDADVLKVGDGEGTAAIGLCPTVHDCAVLLTQICPAAGLATTTMTCLSGFYQGYPQVSGTVEDWISEAVSATSDTASFSIA